MDPLSVAASITGLLTASIQVAKLFAAFIEVNDYARTIYDEIHHFRFILFRLDKYLHSRSINHSRASMIDLDQVVTVLTGSVYTFSQLEREITRLQSRPEGLRRMWWTVARSSLADLVQRLQNHKGTICSMLLILTSESQDEALCGMHELQRQVAELIRINAEMARKFELATAGSGSSVVITSGSVITTQSVSSFSSTRINFTDTLNKSRVYRRALLNRINKPRQAIGGASAPSIQQSWSVLSGISLSEISNYAVYSLPICAQELFNPTWYTTPTLVATLQRNMPELPALLIIGFAEDLKTALKLNDRETAKSIANYIPFDTVLKMSKLYPTVAGDLSNSTGKVLDDMALFRLWLQCGGDKEARDEHDRNAIMIAMEVEDGSLYKDLVQNGSDVNSRWKSKTALHLVSGLGSETFVLGLCDDIVAEDRTRMTQIVPGLGCLRRQAVEVVLGLGAAVNERDEEEETALHHASRSGHWEVVEVLLDHGVDIEAKNSSSWNALHYASAGGHDAVVEILLGHGADIEAKNSSCWNALHYASVGGHEPVVEIILGHGADIEAKDGKGSTALLSASAHGHLGAIEILLSHGADIKATDSQGLYALHYASAGGQRDVVKVLLGHGADIEARTTVGTTPLLSGLENGSRDVVEILLHHGARRGARDWLARTARDYTPQHLRDSVFEGLFDANGEIKAGA